ncbi:MAG: cohesin domain-containing protein [Bacteroidota bacterium]
MKKILSFLGALLLLWQPGLAFAQEVTVSIPTVNASAGETVSVPVNVENFDDVGAITLVIDYDPTSVEFLGTANEVTSGFNATVNGATLRVGWFDQTASQPINLESGKLLDLSFNVIDGTSPLTIDEGASEIADSNADLIDVEFTSGQLGVVGGQISFSSVAAPAIGGTAGVTLEAEGLTGVGAISLLVFYDNSVLEYESLTDNSNLGLEASEVSPGRINIGGFSTAGEALEGIIATLNFSYKGGSAGIGFLDSSEIADVSGDALNVTFVGGGVVESTGSATVVALDDLFEMPGTMVSMPLSGQNLGTVGSVSLEIQFNNAVLTYLADETDAGEFTINQTGPGTLRIGGFFTGGTDLDGDFLNLAFMYNGGSTAVTFNQDVSEIADENATPINAGFVDGSVRDIASVALLQVIHNSPNAGEVDVYINDTLELDDVPFLAATGYLPLGEGDVKIDVVGGAATSNADPVFTLETELEGGDILVAIANGLVGDNFDLDVIPGSLGASDGNVDLSFVHGSPDAPVVDLYVQDETPAHERILTLADDLAFGSATDFAEVPAAYYNVEVATGDGNTQVEVFGAPLTDFGGMAFVVIAQGLLGDGTFQVGAYDVDGNRIQLPVVTSTENPPTIDAPGAYVLHANYPNPFNPTTNISFDLPESADVTVTVVDILGREVMSVNYGTLGAGANQVLEFDASTLASGLYVYRVVATSRTATEIMTGRMTLLK